MKTKITKSILTAIFALLILLVVVGFILRCLTYEGGYEKYFFTSLLPHSISYALICVASLTDIFFDVMYFLYGKHRKAKTVLNAICCTLSVAIFALLYMSCFVIPINGDVWRLVYASDNDLMHFLFANDIFLLGIVAAYTLLRMAYYLVRSNFKKAYYLIPFAFVPLPMIFAEFNLMGADSIYHIGSLSCVIGQFVCAVIIGTLSPTNRIFNYRLTLIMVASFFYWAFVYGFCDYAECMGIHTFSNGLDAALHPISLIFYLAIALTSLIASFKPIRIREIIKNKAIGEIH